MRRVILGLTLVATVFAVTPASPADERRGGLVVSVDPLASAVGAAVLREGGNAVDAAIATGFALAVTHPEAGNIGGGGFMLVRLAKSGECFFVDYRERAPRRATPRMFLDDKGEIDPEKEDVGWLVVGVPGSPMGYWTAHQKAGRLPWRRLVEPAVRLAEEGFEVDEVLARSLKRQEAAFTKFPETARVYLGKDGKAPEPGDRLVLPELSATLRRIMEHGAAGFYQGETAQRLAAAMQRHGGLVTQDDLADYRAVVRTPLRGTYRGHEIISVGPPSSGGSTLIAMLNVLEGYDLRALGTQSPQTLHLLAETMKRCYHDRAKHLGDADFVDVPLHKLLSREHAAAWRSSIGDRATPSETFGGDILTSVEGEQTTHFSVIDADGNMVANTTTLEGGYGAKVIAEGTGFLLNNEMHDFNVRPGVTDRKGLIGTAPNLIAPGKRMLSSQTPTLVLKDGKPFLILGSPGGRTIINTVLQVIVNVVDHGMSSQQAVDAPRIHHQWMPDEVSLEQAFPAETAAGLVTLGHRIARRERQGDCHAILVTPDGRYVPGVDRRIRGAAAGQ